MTTNADAIARVGIVTASLLVVGGIVAAYFAVFSPEVGFAWARVNEECGKSPVLRMPRSGSRRKRLASSHLACRLLFPVWRSG